MLHLLAFSAVYEQSIWAPAMVSFSSAHYKHDNKRCQPSVGLLRPYPAPGSDESVGRSSEDLFAFGGLENLLYPLNMQSSEDIMRISFSI